MFSPATDRKREYDGLTAFIGGETSPYEVMAQVAGDGWRMPASALQNEFNQNGPLRKTLVSYATAFLMQVSYAVACNGLTELAPSDSIMQSAHDA